MTTEDLAALAEQQYRTILGVRDISVDEDVITGRVEGASVPVDHYRRMTSASSLNYISADMRVQYPWRVDVRDGRHRLSIDYFEFDEKDGVVITSQDLLRKNGLEFSSRKWDRNAMIILDAYFKDIFAIEIDGDDDW